VDMRGIERICQALETRFSRYRKEKLKPEVSELAVLRMTNDRLAAFVEQDTQDSKAADAVIASLEGADLPEESGTPSVEAAPSAGEPVQALNETQQPQRIETTRTATADLDRLFRRTEEVYSTCMAQESVIERIMNLRTGLLRHRTELERSRRNF